MALNLAQKLIASHLADGDLTPGSEIALRIDQTLLQDVLGSLVMLELEAMGVERVKVGLAAQYVDHNLVQNDHLNADEHMFLRSACRRFGVWYSRPGNGISHPVHMQAFGKPGQTLVGSDSHSPAAGSLGMLAFGAGGVEVALAMAGEPLYLRMPRVWGVKLTGQLPDWVSAKDVILEMLRRHGVEGGFGRIVEYYGPGLDTLSAMDRHVIANMGAEMGATTSVFPSDEATRQYLASVGREADWVALGPDAGATYDDHEEIDLSTLVPLIARPSSPGNVVPVSEAAGEEIYQSYIGSSANPGFRDFAVTAEIVKGSQVHDRVSFDVNPSTRQVLETLIAKGHLSDLIHAGARVHQAGCNGCIGMGQAPASGRNSLRTVPRNFPGRSGTREDSVFLCSPETAAASALSGVITDPRTLAMPYPRVAAPEMVKTNTTMLVPPLPEAEARAARLEKTDNITTLPELGRLGQSIRVPVLLKTGDDISTDDIMPAGARVMPYWSNIPKTSDFTFEPIDPTYPQRAKQAGPGRAGHAILGGLNYGQGSSRENAALAPRYLGLETVLAKSFARIHWQNLVNFGVLPLTFADPADYDGLEIGDMVEIEDVAGALKGGKAVTARVRGREIALRHDLSARQIEVLLAGGVINWLRARLQSEPARTVA
ncbi:aconitate hydratase [Methylobacterium dankookense]|uniref:2,3-dimethylmalate dehydratase large subunit n=1 Tax=Methylobacterium dankookense TaxID=560405 RepID=A0A564G390_9HYPH|nr:aconitate hydratase [Methylobacterium dankookense]GJD54699.1 3-isopropylmalate dehydratase large subunit [Methylobacterium dankookense]VUF14408.1 2,3-dimethylmalate dehydratase large subunit [Methylobacterium dankookense]